MSGRSSGRGGGGTASQLESLQEESGESDQSTEQQSVKGSDLGKTLRYNQTVGALGSNPLSSPSTSQISSSRARRRRTEMSKTTSISGIKGSPRQEIEEELEEDLTPDRKLSPLSQTRKPGRQGSLSPFSASPPLRKKSDVPSPPSGTTPRNLKSSLVSLDDADFLKDAKSPRSPLLRSSDSSPRSSKSPQGRLSPLISPESSNSLTSPKGGGSRFLKKSPAATKVNTKNDDEIPGRDSSPVSTFKKNKKQLNDETPRSSLFDDNDEEKEKKKKEKLSGDGSFADLSSSKTKEMKQEQKEFKEGYSWLAASESPRPKSPRTPKGDRDEFEISGKKVLRDSEEDFIQGLFSSSKKDTRAKEKESRSPVGRRSFDEDEEEQDKKVVSGKRPSMKSSEKIRSPSESPKRSISRTKSYERDSFDKKEEEKGRGDGRDMKRDEGARDDKLKQKSKERFTGSPSSGGRLSSVSGLPPLSKGDAEKGRTPENKKPEKSIWDTTSDDETEKTDEKKKEKENLKKKEKENMKKEGEQAPLSSTHSSPAHHSTSDKKKKRPQSGRNANIPLTSTTSLFFPPPAPEEPEPGEDALEVGWETGKIRDRAFSVWYERKQKVLREKDVEMKEKEKEKERQEKEKIATQKASEELFAQWKKEKDAQLAKKQKEKREKEREKVEQEKRDKVDKEKQMASTFQLWKDKKEKQKAEDRQRLKEKREREDALKGSDKNRSKSASTRHSRGSSGQGTTVPDSYRRPASTKTMEMTPQEAYQSWEKRKSEIMNEERERQKESKKKQHEEHENERLQKEEENRRKYAEWKERKRHEELLQASSQLSSTQALIQSRPPFKPLSRYK
ncbi:uncharacterized protein LOC142349580 isoform X2 [Convolutriloba macropyga]|uniref:uncharacterized protein LOC142349580 isoform X2 n=1 Tax=Convolutriloba macropyga TaxID=536237 RepID=UPI003F520B9D